MKQFILLVFLFTFAVSTVFAGSIAGKVTAKKSGEALVGANVYLKGTTFGAATDEDGMYYIKVDDGEYVVVCDYVSFSVEQAAVTVEGDTKHDFMLVEHLFAKTIEVMADRAKDRETPVAYTNISKAKMEAELGSQDIPMILNTTPSVYATMQGGGAGDARINVRGFNQSNVAIMINGVPVNDMENGWVYWSNWDGVGDATASIQMQRGLSAVNLATPAIGGTMNIITDPTAMDMGFKLKQEVGSGAFLKTTFSAASGLIDGKWAVNALAVRKTGDGIIDGVWTDAWAYYMGAAYNINDNNRVELYAVGAPQRHGQNLYRQNIGAYSHDFAKDLDTYDPLALDDYAEASSGRNYNQTWNEMTINYDGKQGVGTNTFDRFDSGFLNERENFYHKPQINLNYFSNFTDYMSFSTVLYFSGGFGGGTGSRGSWVWDYDSEPTRIPDWDATIQRNMDSDEGSTGILRNSRNNQSTYGLISKLNWKAMDNLNTSFGVDWRTAEIEHYYEVRDLLGGDYYIADPWDQSDFWEADKQLGIGDKLNYFNTNTVNWLGAFAQAEYTMDKITAYATVGYSGVTYSYIDHFQMADDGDAFNLEADPVYGYQVKGGAMYRLTATADVFANFGYVEKVPIFDNVIDDNSGIFTDNPENEKFTSFEAGANWKGLGNTLSIKGSFYYTLWQDRALARSVNTSEDNWDILFLTGLDQLHTGFEFEAAYQPMRMFRIDLAGSIAKWEHVSDAAGDYRAIESDVLVEKTYLVGVDGLKIGDAPQTQIALAGSVFPVKGATAQLVYRYYDNFWADWAATSRVVFDGAEPDREQSWKTPGYALLDFHGSYNLPFELGGIKMQLFAHVFNILDIEYISDAVDNSSYNGFDDDHDADDAEVYMGLPRRFNVGVSFSY